MGECGCVCVCGCVVVWVCIEANRNDRLMGLVSWNDWLMYVTMLSWMASSDATCAIPNHHACSTVVEFWSGVSVNVACRSTICACVHNVEPPASTAYLATSTSVAIPCYYIATTVHLLTLHSLKGSLYLLVQFDVWIIISPCASVHGGAYTIYIHRYVQVCVHVWDFTTDHAWRLNGSLTYSYICIIMLSN